MIALRSWSSVSLILAIAGILVASYLTYVSFNLDALTCSIGDCGTVQSSDYARVFGIPIAIFGLGMYLTVLGLGTLRVVRPSSDELTTFALFALVMLGTVYAGYLTYVEIWVIEAICQWCVISAILTLGLAISESTQVTRLLRE